MIRCLAGTAIAGLALALGGCFDPDPQDWLIAEARSPDGRMVARLWCADLCDVPGRLVLTLGTPGRASTLAPAEPPFPPKGDMPEADALAVLRDGNAPDFPTAALAWTRGRSLTVFLPCPESDVRKPAPAAFHVRGMWVVVKSSAPCRPPG